jgi:hypothetical protein
MARKCSTPPRRGLRPSNGTAAQKAVNPPGGTRCRMSGPSSNADILRAAMLAQNAARRSHPTSSGHAEAAGGGEDPVVHGRDALRTRLVDARQQVGELRITPHELQESGDAVLVIRRPTG